MQEFLNPKSMLTPGVAGGVVMVIASALYVQFDLPAKYTALGMCFVICLFVFSSAAGAAVLKLPVEFKVILYLLNSLVMFAVAMGTHAPLQAVKPGKVIARNIQNGHVIEKEAQFSAWLQKHEVNQARDALLRVGGLVEDLRTKAQQASSELPASSVVRTEVDRLEQQLTFAVSRYNDQKFLVERMERESALLGSSDELILVDPKSLERSFTDPWF